MILMFVMLIQQHTETVWAVHVLLSLIMQFLSKTTWIKPATQTRWLDLLSNKVDYLPVTPVSIPQHDKTSNPSEIYWTRASYLSHTWDRLGWNKDPVLFLFIHFSSSSCWCKTQAAFTSQFLSLVSGIPEISSRSEEKQTSATFFFFFLSLQRDIDAACHAQTLCPVFVFLRRTQRLLFLVVYAVFWPLHTCHSHPSQPVHSAAGRQGQFSFCELHSLSQRTHKYVIVRFTQKINYLIIVPTKTDWWIALDLFLQWIDPKLNFHIWAFFTPTSQLLFHFFFTILHAYESSYNSVVWAGWFKGSGFMILGLEESGLWLGERVPTEAMW